MKSVQQEVKSPLNPEAAELIARRFRALSDPTRLRILDYLRNHDEASVGEIAEALGASQQNVSKHLSALHAEGFVARRKRGTSSLYRISRPGRPRNLRRRLRRHRSAASRARGRSQIATSPIGQGENQEAGDFANSMVGKDDPVDLAINAIRA